VWTQTKVRTPLHSSLHCISPHWGTALRIAQALLFLSFASLSAQSKFSFFEFGFFSTYIEPVAYEYGRFLCPVYLFCLVVVS